jgi:hypothetical protein
MRQYLTRFLSSTVVIMLAAAATAGAYHRISRVEAFDTQTWTVWTAAGTSRIEVKGDGDTDLDCYVYDLSGRLLEKADDKTDHCVIDVSRARSGNLRVHVVNLGNVYNRYELRVR